MARYDCTCEEHGPFVVTKAMTEAHDPVFCPVCQKPAKQLFSGRSVTIALPRRWMPSKYTAPTRSEVVGV